MQLNVEYIQILLESPIRELGNIFSNFLLTQIPHARNVTDVA